MSRYGTNHTGRPLSGHPNRTSGRVAAFRGRSRADVIAYCTALLALREAEAAAEMKRLEAQAAWDEDRRRGRNAEERRQGWGLVGRPHPAPHR